MSIIYRREAERWPRPRNIELYGDAALIGLCIAALYIVGVADARHEIEKAEMAAMAHGVYQWLASARRRRAARSPRLWPLGRGVYGHVAAENVYGVSQAGVGALDGRRHAVR